MQTVASLLGGRAHDTGPGLLAGDRRWTWAEVVAESRRRAGVLQQLRGEGPFHVGVLLDNVPEYLFLLGGAALAGATIVGINPTRRGTALGDDIRHTDCQLLVTDAAGATLLAEADHGVGPDRIVRVDRSGYEAALPEPAALGERSPADLLLLLFTSGTTGAPKAVRCTQGRLAAIGERVVPMYGFAADDVCYCIMPLFHGNALMALWSGALATGAAVALPSGGRFSASTFLADVRRYRATYFTYVGKALTYILATPPAPDDADNTLTRGFGNEASEEDIASFAKRFGCRIVEGYGSSEGGATINRVPDMPSGSLGRGAPGVMVASPDGVECPPARFDAGGQLLNGDEAIGEIVNTAGAAGFEGYYRNREGDAERTRNGWYWTGDLGYRDAEGFFYFAGRGADWLRVDGENFAAAPVERILGRYPAVRMAAVYAVPDPLAGDAVMCAVVADPFDAAAFSAFLAAQADLGTKWAPRFVRLMASLPLTATGKVTKLSLRREGWETGDTVWWRPDPRSLEFAPLDAAGRRALGEEFGRHGRSHLLSAP